jgi:hypothetical protein
MDGDVRGLQGLVEAELLGGGHVEADAEDYAGTGATPLMSLRPKRGRLSGNRVSA